VRYVLEGSVRRSGDKVRVNTQLIDAERDAHIWADRFDLHADDLLWLQDEVTGRIANALNQELVQAEAARSTANPDALDYVLRGRAVYNKGPTRENFAEAIRLYERALTLDPACVPAKALLARTLTARVLDQLADAPLAELERADTLIGEVLATSPRDPVGHLAKAQLLRARNRYDEAIPEYEIAVALNRNWVIAIAALGQCKFLAGAIEEAIPAQEQAIRLSPRDPHIANWYWRIGMVHLLKSRTGDAIEWLQKAQRANPLLAGPRAWLAAAYALAGDADRAAGELAEAGRLGGDDRYSSIARFRHAVAFGEKTHALAETTFFAGLRKAGVPEE
jgi:adenylate cyclase